MTMEICASFLAQDVALRRQIDARDACARKKTETSKKNTERNRLPDDATSKQVIDEGECAVRPWRATQLMGKGPAGCEP
jgi:hypothetical protein